jgi:hypothetical protein
MYRPLQLPHALEASTEKIFWTASKASSPPYSITSTKQEKMEAHIGMGGKTLFSILASKMSRYESCEQDVEIRDGNARIMEI